MYGCGQCLGCRIARREVWTTRQTLESYAHVENSFATLTYSDDHLPSGQSLQPQHLRDFLKRLRARISPARFRFYGVGEYGDESNRPHYHLTLFGVSGRTDIISKNRVRHFGISGVVQAAWPLGNTLVLEATPQTFRYVAGYTVKKMTAKDDPRLNGRHPEFARMSNRDPGGIGASFLPDLKLSLASSKNLSDGRIVRIDGKKQYIGPYLLRKLTDLREPDANKVQEFKDQKSWEASLKMLALYDHYKNDSEVLTRRQAYQKSVLQKLRSLESLASIHKKRASL